MADVDALIGETSKVLEAAWSGWGELAPHVLGHLINPTFMGGPRWPAMRQAFRIARKGELTLVASDGLSDPFDDEGAPKVNGFGLEVYAMTREPVGDVAASWLFSLVWNAAQLCAGNGQVADMLEEMKLISTELHVRMPPEAAARYVNEHGRVGVLIGQATELPKQVQGPLSPIRLVNLQLLTREELADVVKRGPKGREAAAERFAQAGVAGVSALAV
jgi:hypothetical protein